jgi:ABC-type dipeptide/oligopeptide/nickel transport system permease component
MAPVRTIRWRRLTPRNVYFTHLLRNAAVGGGIVVLSLGIGIVGYRATEQLSWLDSLLNAAMILTGEGPVAPMRTAGGKLFASFYSLFSGVAFLTAIGVLFAPAMRRFLHRFHLDFMVDDGDPAPTPRTTPDP